MTSKPMTSRYTSKVLTVSFKERQNIFYIPSFFLQDQSWLQKHMICATSSWKFSEQVGHVLIHYMYTGDYQPLNIESGNSVESKIQEKLRIAVQVLLALGHWQFPRLKEMVQSEIGSLSSSIPTYDTFYIFDNELHSAGYKFKEEQEEWLINFLMNSLNVALENNSIDRGDLSLFNKLQHMKIIKSFTTKFFEFYISQNLNTNEKLAQKQDIQSHDTDSMSAVIHTPSTLPRDDTDMKLKEWLEDDYVIEYDNSQRLVIVPHARNALP